MKQYLPNLTKLNINLVFTLLALCAIIWIGNKLRVYNYAQVPLPGETRDEYSFAWLGLSLIQDNYPIAWSGIGAYENTNQKYINVDQIFDTYPNQPAFPIDKPWFDHPPLFGLIVGGYAHLKGVDSFEEASVIILRRPMLKLAVIDLILVFWLASRLFDKKTGLLASLLVAIVPVIAISSRLALAENGYIPLILVTMISADYYFETKKIKFWIISVFMGFLAILMKLSGVSIFVYLLLLGILYGTKQKLNLTLITITGMVLALTSFVLYGYYFGWETFLNVFQTNAQRFYGSSSEIIIHAVVKSKVVNDFSDGWVTAGWISFFVVMGYGWMKNKKIMALSLMAVAYALVYILFGSEPYGWYRYPFYPILMIFTARYIIKLYKDNNLPLFIMLLMLPVGTAVHRLVGVEGFQKYVTLLRYGVIFFIISLIIYFCKPKYTLFIKVFMLIFLTLSIFVSIKLIYFYDVNKWYFAT